MTQRLQWTSRGDTITATLSTDHAASNHGVPVLLYEQQILGPGDTMRFNDGSHIPAGEYVTYAALALTDRTLADRFLAAVPPLLGETRMPGGWSTY